ncbi:MAG: phage tail protein [Pseudomonadota bacterium]
MLGSEFPVAFHFSVAIVGTGVPIFDTAFSEVTGLETEMELETVTEGGENRFQHRLPKGIKHQNLVLKRGLTSIASGLLLWCKDTLENDLSDAISTKAMIVSLQDESGWPSATWSIDRAYPVKWSVGGFDAMKNELAIETMEFAFSTLKRVL